MGEQEEQLIAQLAAMISACFKSAVSPAAGVATDHARPADSRSATCAALDLGYHPGDRQGAQGGPGPDDPGAEIDEFDDLMALRRAQRPVLVKKVAERISSDLRATDMMARLSSKFALLIPGSGGCWAGDRRAHAG